MDANTCFTLPCTPGDGTNISQNPLPGFVTVHENGRPLRSMNGYGLRVPGLVISPYARPGFIDHQILSFDAFLKFTEDRSSEASAWTRRRTGDRTHAPPCGGTSKSSAIFGTGLISPRTHCLR